MAATADVATVCSVDGHEYQRGICVSCHVPADPQALADALVALMEAEGGEAGESKGQRRAWRKAQDALRKAGY